MTRSEMGEKMRQYFIEVEKQYQAIATKPLSTLDLFSTQLQIAKEKPQAEIAAIKKDVKVLQAQTTICPDYLTVTVLFRSFSQNIVVGSWLHKS